MALDAFAGVDDETEGVEDFVVLIHEVGNHAGV
jgi:hypothetical protein